MSSFVSFGICRLIFLNGHLVLPSLCLFWIYWNCILSSYLSKWMHFLYKQDVRERQMRLLSSINQWEEMTDFLKLGVFSNLLFIIFELCSSDTASWFPERKRAILRFVVSYRYVSWTWILLISFLYFVLYTDFLKFSFIEFMCRQWLPLHRDKGLCSLTLCVDDGEYCSLSQHSFCEHFALLCSWCCQNNFDAGVHLTYRLRSPLHSVFRLDAVTSHWYSFWGIVCVEWGYLFSLWSLRW